MQFSFSILGGDLATGVHIFFTCDKFTTRYCVNGYNGYNGG